MICLVLVAFGVCLCFRLIVLGIVCFCVYLLVALLLVCGGVLVFDFCGVVVWFDIGVHCCLI